MPNKLEIEIKTMSRDNIKLDAKVNISDSVLDLYHIIQSETGKVNIISTIINNDYLLNIEKLNGSYIKVDILSINDKPQIIDDIFSCKVSTLLDENYNEDYNKDYIEVLLIFGSYISYIKSIFTKYANEIRIINFFIDLRYLDNYNDQIRKENKTEFSKLNKTEFSKLNKIINNFKDGMSKLNNDCISSDDYDEIESYILKDTIEFKHQIVVLYEIKKYIDINRLDLTLSNNI